MNSLLTVNNNVSLVSITIAPSTFLVTVVLVLVLLAIYIPRLSLGWFPRLGLSSLFRNLIPNPSAPSTAPARLDKPLPDAAFADSQLVFQDQQLVFAGQDLVFDRLRENEIREDYRLLQAPPRRPQPTPSHPLTTPPPP
ncbi:hypothetical protein G7046_g9563 [Stylonectria norvegica]|nr:hypothetical protein G7046_g9563 [Stylonectria norvegica]